MLWLVPGIAVGALSYLQVNAEIPFKYRLSEKGKRAALWLNALGSVGFCLMVALQRGPNENSYDINSHYSYIFLGIEESTPYILLAIEFVTLASFGLGILVSIFNILPGLIRLRNPAIEKWRWKTRFGLENGSERDFRAVRLPSSTKALAKARIGW